jgi:hypothetical protein
MASIGKKDKQPEKLTFLLYLSYIFCAARSFPTKCCHQNGWHLASQTLAIFDVRLKKGSNYAKFMHKNDVDKTFGHCQVEICQGAKLLTATF